MSRNSAHKSHALSFTARATPIGRERRVSTHLPFTHFVDVDIIGTRDGDMMLTLHLSGAPSETVDASVIEQRFNERAHLFLTALSASVQIYHHFVRREEKFYPEGQFTNDFAKDLDQAWETKLDERRQYRNDHYLTLVLRPNAEEVSAGLFGAKKRILSAKARAEAIRTLRELGEVMIAGLREYEPRLLVMDADAQESEALSLFGFMLTGEWRRIAPPRQNLSDAIASSRMYFARETVAMRGVTEEETRFAACLGFKEYPPETYPSMLRPLLSVNAEFVITQAFSPVLRDRAATAIQLQQRRMAVAEDAAESLRTQLSGALDDLASGRTLFGNHHIGVTVYAPVIETLQKTLSSVRAQMMNAGLTVVREDMNMEPAFWAMFPGNFAYAGGRAAMISSANFAGLVNFNAAPQGEKSSVWGEAISVFQTTAATPFLFNFHVADVGNTVLFGPTGSGKTALLSFLIAQAERVNPRIIIMDKDRGSEILVRALGGQYVSINPGIDARLNPFRIDARGHETETRAFLTDWVTSLLYGSDFSQADPQAQRAIRLAVDEVRDAPAENRRLDVLAQVLGGGEGGDDLLDRLSPWIGAGDRTWAFNSGRDEFGSIFDARVMGVDLTKILDDPRASAPWMMYLFNRIEEALTDGRPTLIVLDEAWRMLADETFATRIQNWMKVIRKQNGAVIFATQEPEDAIASAAGKTVIAQAPTQILLPNPRADEAAYLEGLRISEFELELVRSIGTAGRYMMIRRNDKSVIAKFDMGGMPEFIDVLSARTESINEMEALRAEHGEDGWLDVFMDRRRKDAAKRGEAA